MMKNNLAVSQISLVEQSNKILFLSLYRYIEQNYKKNLTLAPQLEVILGEEILVVWVMQ